jgi:hypothetical protein
MEVILDELTPAEFFNHGGIVKLTIDEHLAEEFNMKKKFTFFDYKTYVRFFRGLYMSYIQNHQDENTYDSYNFVNANISVLPLIGNSEYVVDLKYDQVRSYEAAKFYYSHDRRDVNVVPRDPYGIPNVCFTLIDETDERWDEYEKQRLERGFDVSETWSFDATISKFIYPRLKVFLEDTKRLGVHPASLNSVDDWVAIIEKMIKGFELLTLDRIKTDDENKIIEEALDLFREYFHSLWT